MTGKIVDVFEISGRGCIVLVEIVSGILKMGDTLTAGAKTWQVSGIEMVNYSAQGVERMMQGWMPAVGVLLRDARKDDFASLIGTEVSGSSHRERE